jgi:hypothetical protein
MLFCWKIQTGQFGRFVKTTGKGMVPAIADRWGRRKSLVAVGGWSRFEVFKGRASQIDPARPQSDRRRCR